MSGAEGEKESKVVIRNTSLLDALALRAVTGAVVVRADTTVEYVTDTALAQLDTTREEIAGGPACSSSATSSGTTRRSSPGRR